MTEAARMHARESSDLGPRDDGHWGNSGYGQPAAAESATCWPVAEKGQAHQDEAGQEASQTAAGPAGRWREHGRRPRR